MDDKSPDQIDDRMKHSYPDVDELLTQQVPDDDPDDDYAAYADWAEEPEAAEPYPIALN